METDERYFESIKPKNSPRITLEEERENLIKTFNDGYFSGPHCCVRRTQQKESSFSESKQNFQEQKERVPQPPSFHPSGYDMIFWITVAFSQLIGIVCISLVFHWCTLYGGFAWSSNANLQFNFHPLLMILGLIFLYGDAILIYRVLHFLPKWLLKWIHAALNLSVLIMSSVGLVAVFENHRRKNLPDMYSIHSWVGITSFGFFCVQYIFSFLTFLFPGMPLYVRTKIMPFHTFFGLGIFMLAVASALMGITEKLIFDGGYGSLPNKAVVGNSLGIFIVLFTFLVAYIATRSKYRRRSLPSDSVSVSTTN